MNGGHGQHERAGRTRDRHQVGAAPVLAGPGTQDDVARPAAGRHQHQGQTDGVEADRPEAEQRHAQPGQRRPEQIEASP